MSPTKIGKGIKDNIKSSLKDAWEKRRSQHLIILGMLTVIGIALLIWAILFFTLFSSNAQQEANSWENYTAATWVGVLFALTVLIFIIPEFFHYLGTRNSLIEMLETDSRAELQKNKRDLDEGVKLLSGRWPAILEAKRVELGLRKEMPDGMDLPPEDTWINNWLNTKNSRWAERFPNSDLLKDAGINQIIIGFSLIGLMLFLYNAMFGLAREVVGGPRNMTVDFTMIATGSEYNATWAPHIDLLGGLIILLFATFLFMTSPAPQESSDIVDLEEE